jgi:hypothetical protein
MVRDAHPAHVVLAVALVAGAGLAGCLGGDGSADALPYSSYEEARDAHGPVYAPTNVDSSVRMKLLEPADPSSVATENVTVTVLLFDNATDEPVTDASFILDAQMPSMGHGTSNGNPTHVDFGVYRGWTEISMPGEWVLNLDPQLADGTVLEFDVGAKAGGGGGGHHGDGPDTSARYDTFNEALDAEGETVDPVNATGDRNMKVKFLDPASTDGAETGKQPLVLLLYDADAAEPVTDGTVSLSSWMPGMGHGTHGEEDPTHKDHGEWGGVTNFTMEGTWEVNLTAEPPSGGSYEWQVEFQVGEGSMDG